MDTDWDREMDRNMDRDAEGMRTGTRMGTGIKKGTGTFPRGIRPRGTTFEFKNLGKFENNLGYDSGFHIGLIHEKTEAQNLMPLSL